MKLEQPLIRAYITCPHCECQYYVTYTHEFVYTCKQCEGAFVLRMRIWAEKKEDK